MPKLHRWQKMSFFQMMQKSDFVCTSVTSYFSMLNFSLQIWIRIFFQSALFNLKSKIELKWKKNIKLTRTMKNFWLEVQIFDPQTKMSLTLSCHILFTHAFSTLRYKVTLVSTANKNLMIVFPKNKCLYYCKFSV